MPADRRCFLGGASISLAGVMLAGPTGTFSRVAAKGANALDPNAAYRMAYAQIFEQEHSENLLSSLKGKKVLLVPGFLAQLVQIVGIPERLISGLGPYF